MFRKKNLQTMNVPRLILIGGCTGSGKSTLGMNVALSQGILKCISTDSIRQVMRAFDTTPALHRSSYAGTSDPILDWREACEVLSKGINSIVEDSLKRRTSLVLEGVHLIPTATFINKWVEGGGKAVGILLVIPDRESHISLLQKRGKFLNKSAESQINSISRIRAIQTAMTNLA